MAFKLSGVTPSAPNRWQICLALKPMSTSIRQFSVVIRALFPPLPLPRIASSNTESFISQIFRHAKPKCGKRLNILCWQGRRCPFVVASLVGRGSRMACDWTEADDQPVLTTLIHLKPRRAVGRALGHGSDFAPSPPLATSDKSAHLYSYGQRSAESHQVLRSYGIVIREPLPTKGMRGRSSVPLSTCTIFNPMLFALANV